MRSILLRFVYLWCVAGSGSLANAVTYVVSESTCVSGGNCSLCGSSWSNAFPNLQEAIDCTAEGGQVWVAQGVYAPITLKSGVRVMGGFAGSETAASQSDSQAHSTIIDAQRQGRAVLSVNNDSSTELRGFVIRNGTDLNWEGGGGMRVLDSSVMVVDCEFHENCTVFGGGAVVTDGSESPYFANCRFHDNGFQESNGTTTCDTLGGGAVFVAGGNPTFVNCLFHDNRGWDGGAVVAQDLAAGKLINCTIVDNHAVIGVGGGVSRAKTLAIQNCIIWFNKAARSAPTIYDDHRATTGVTYSNVDGGFPGTGNMSQEPKFVDRAGRNYMLKAFPPSPGKDKGRAELLPSDLGDLDWDGDTPEAIPFDLSFHLGNGAPRVVGLQVDIGAYEIWLGCTY